MLQRAFAYQVCLADLRSNGAPSCKTRSGTQDDRTRQRRTSRSCAGRWSTNSCVQVIAGDGTLGFPEEAPFDAIVVTAGAETLPDAYIRQLQVGGRIVIPIGRSRHNQTMYRFTRLDEQLRVENLGGFAFVPLIGKYGWHERDIK